MEKKTLGIIFGGVVLAGACCFGTYLIGSQTAETTINEHVVTLKNSQKMIDEKSKELAETQSNLDELRSDSKNKRDEIEKLEDELKETKKIISEKDNESTKLEEIKKEITAKNEESNSITAEIDKMNKELERLTKGVATAKAEPRSIPAGEFEVGKDIDAGRYRITSTNGRNGNFFINNGSDANIIIGSDNFGTPEYITTLDSGDTIEQTVGVTYQLVE